jgi:tetratricopeptide (TPR) repeat protein
VISSLIAESFAARFVEPARMLQLARTAAASADALSRLDQRPEISDLAADAHRAFGAGLRVAGDFSAAHSAIDAAMRFALSGTGSPVVAANLREERAAIYLRQRRLRSALRLLNGVVAVRRSQDNPHALAFSLVRRSVAENELGNHRDAVDSLTEAMPLIDRHRDPRLMLAAAHNLAEYLLDGKRPADALVALDGAESLYKEVGDHLLALRRLWIHGRVARELGCSALAELKLRGALDGYLAARVWYEAAFVGLELSHLLVVLGRSSEAEHSAALVESAFEGAAIPSEAIAARLLRRAAAAQFEYRAADCLLRAGASLRRAGARR